MDIDEILVPVDFSACSKAALERACDLASQFGSRLHILHVVSPLPYPPDFGYGEEVLEDAEARAIVHLESWAGEVRARGIEVVERVELGKAAETICRLAARVDASLIVMGTYGHAGMAHGLLGSVAGRTARRAPCPVWIVPGAESVEPVRRVLVATDFSSHSEQALELATNLCRSLGAELHLIHIFHSPIPVYAEVPNRASLREEFRQSAIREIENAASKVDRSGLSISATIEEGATGPAVVDYATSHDVDLIVVGTRGNRGLRRAFMGSVAEHIAHIASCSVLIAAPTHARRSNQAGGPDAPERSP